MINLEWVQHRSGIHRMFPSSSDVKDEKGNLLVTSYAVIRPDGDWSVMLVNRDENNAHPVRLSFNAGGNGGSSFSGPVRFATFGSEQYVWLNDGPNSHPDPDNPPIATTIDASRDTVFILPKASVSVLRGKIEGQK
jgi:hypothetical protein